MLLAVDVGNTNILFGIFDDNSLVFKARISSDRKITSEQYALAIKGVVNLKNTTLENVQGAIISSVVPELTGRIREAIAMLTGVDAIVLGPGVKSGLSIKIDNPAQLGADLVAGAVGAIDKYNAPCLVIDLGTATKISVIDAYGAYRGCVIAAGVGISLNALSGAASLLPVIDINSGSCPAYGTNTVASMQSGIVQGTASMLDGMCDKIEASLGERDITVIATGGYADSILPYCRRKIISEPDLVLRGLKKIYEKN